MTDLNSLLTKSLTAFDANRDRSKQVEIGPSSLGGCRRQVYYNLIAQPVTNPETESLAAILGTFIHSGISEAIVEAVGRKESKILGICLGMQLLGQSSTENGFTDGLGLITSKSEKFNNDDNSDIKIPHVGFNSVYFSEKSILFKQLERGSDFYFTHSYKMTISNLEGLESTAQYAGDFLAAYENENIFATQFHPEKSQSNGLRLLNNFIMA